MNGFNNNISIQMVFSDQLKTKLSKAFLSMTNTRLWGERISKFGITKFAKNSTDEYYVVKELKESVKNVGIGVRYY